MIGRVAPGKTVSIAAGGSQRHQYPRSQAIFSLFNIDAIYSNGVLHCRKMPQTHLFCKAAISPAKPNNHLL
jgi:hypothetical protein